ncbi:hypothetical protein FSP39_014649 [Pinctada imbricata]|uniref:Mab-21-like HhH/H2TH-like domain-containing protein n=1 Tax=Pinctada imbricata TaxID=66713 RepID=A0AA88Y8F8_PINIB|nr:hypothetical protein FSP39_014649 [Pinctada imbricata]
MSIYITLTYLFGTELILNLRRQLVLLRERLKSYGNDNLHYICSGSLGEGVAYPPSDDDLMVYRTGRRVVSKPQEGTQDGDVVMARINGSPGYCLLLDIRNCYPQNVQCDSDGIPFVSSSLWKEHINPPREDCYIHGPCHTFAVGDDEYDVASVIPCSFWPDIACDWISRKRSHGWPSHDTIQDIVRDKCHVVPIGDPDSPLQQHAWRISFSVAERTLMHSLNHVQFLTYNLLRLTLKRIIDKKFPGIICSYFMKTTLFYTIEKTSAQLWTAHNLEACFKVCLSTLYDFIDNINCPNYFIPEYNMIKRKVNRTNRQELLDTIRNIHSTDTESILSICGEPSNMYLEERLSLQIMEWRFDREIYDSVHVVKLTSVIYDVITETTVSSMCKFVHFLLGKGTFSRYVVSGILLQRLVVCCCLKLMDTFVRLAKCK